MDYNPLQLSSARLHLVLAERGVRRQVMTSLTARLAQRGAVRLLDGGNSFDGYSLARALHQQAPQWRAAQRRGVATDLGLRPTNLLLVIASAAISRAFLLVPGIMFGMPEAFEIDRKRLDGRTDAYLQRVSAATIAVPEATAAAFSDDARATGALPGLSPADKAR